MHLMWRGKESEMTPDTWVTTQKEGMSFPKMGGWERSSLRSNNREFRFDQVKFEMPIRGVVGCTGLESRVEIWVRENSLGVICI